MCCNCKKRVIHLIKEDIVKGKEAIFNVYTINTNSIDYQHGICKNPLTFGDEDGPYHDIFATIECHNNKYSSNIALQDKWFKIRNSDIITETVEEEAIKMPMLIVQFGKRLSPNIYIKPVNVPEDTSALTDEELRKMEELKEIFKQENDALKKYNLDQKYKR